MFVHLNIGGMAMFGKIRVDAVAATITANLRSLSKQSVHSNSCEGIWKFQSFSSDDPLYMVCQCTKCKKKKIVAFEDDSDIPFLCNEVEREIAVLFWSILNSKDVDSAIAILHPFIVNHSKSSEVDGSLDNKIKAIINTYII